MDPHVATEFIHAAAAAAAVMRLVHLNLAKRFPALLAYLIFLAVINLGYGLMNSASEYYFWSYMVFESLECVFSILAVRELFSLSVNDYPGIRTVGRWVMYAGVALALGVALILTRFFWSSEASGRSHSHLFYLQVSKRAIVFCLAAVIIAILLFLSKYPLHLSRNTVVSSAFFSAMFLSEAMRLLIDSLAPQLYNLYVDWTQSIFISICLVGWAAFLQQESRKPPKIKVSRPHDDQLLQQLSSLNQIMARAARR